MKSTVKLKINERVEFSVEDEVYKSTIQDIISENSIAISVPVSGGKNYTPHPGEVVQFFVLLNNYYHEYKGNLGNRIIDGNLRLLIIEDLKYIGKVQRRENYRIPLSIDVSYIPITKEIADKGVSKKIVDLLSEKFKDAKSIDLSAGGIKILTKDKIDVNTYIILKINLNTSEEICLISKVIRVDKDIEMKIYKIGCSFKNLDKADSERIVKFIFERSRDLMKR